MLYTAALVFGRRRQEKVQSARSVILGERVQLLQLLRLQLHTYTINNRDQREPETVGIIRGQVVR